MRIRGCTFFIFFLFIVFVDVSAQRSPWPSTFLWRISGNGLAKDSWLYGTMHMQDKRLFRFSDSLYTALEKAEGFALEVDVREFIDSLIRRSLALAEDEEEPIQEIKDKVKEKSVVDSLVKIVTKDKKARKQLAQYRRQRLVNLLKYGEMPTIMDAYLYGLARRHGKWLGAVEDVSDQLGLYDEIGDDLDEDELNMPDEKLRNTLEDMIRIYLAQDLQAIEDDYIQSFSDAIEDKLLNKRNIKMANSMDSLSAVRSMFYAVGAAHLPGEKGVISLLRQKGYTVEPVFSAGKTDAEKYAATLNDVPWITMIEAVDNLYSVDMPGIPSDYNMFGDLVKMKMYMDITTMTVYMTGHALSHIDEKMLDEALDNMAKNMSAYGKPQNKKLIIKDGSRGIDGVIFSKHGYYKIQLLIKENILYVLMVGADKKAQVLSDDAYRFLSSFKFNQESTGKKNGEWVRFSLEEKAFSILMPSKPNSNKKLEKNAEGSEWNFTVYDLTDVSTALYYVVQVRDIQPGYYLQGDSAWFASFKNIMKDAESVITDRAHQWQGFPAYDYGVIDRGDDLFMKTRNVIRGNRVYTLMVAGNKNLKDDPAADKFFESLSLLDYKEMQGKKMIPVDGSFETWTAYPFVSKMDADDEADPDRIAHYTSYDPHQAVSYEVIKERVSPYAWYRDESIFFEKMIKQYQRYSDSVVDHTVTRNGKLTAHEWVIRMQDDSKLKKIKSILNGDTLYILYSIIYEKYINGPLHKQFFDSFRVTGKVAASTVFTNKAKEYFEALSSRDSLTFSQAADAYDKIDFSESELSYLHQGLTQYYLDDSAYYMKVHDNIIGTLEDMAHSSTLDFIRDNYPRLNAEKEKLKKGMLSVLAGIKTRASYDLLKQLIVSNPPAAEAGNHLAYKITDSLQLCSTLFPELLQLAGDPFFWQELTVITQKMLDSALLGREILAPYKKHFINHADTVLQSLQSRMASGAEEVYGYQYLDLLRVLAACNDPGANEILKKYQAADLPELKQEAILLLLKNGMAADQKEVGKIAANNEFRAGFYDKLKAMGYENLFPAKYKTQKYFAEAVIYSYASDDYEPSAIVYLGERSVLFDGKKSKFYLFRVEYDYEDDESGSEAYFAAAGPYSTDEKDISTGHAVTGIWFDEAYDKKLEQQHFKELLKQGEAYLEKQKELVK